MGRMDMSEHHETEKASSDQIKVWDIYLRLFHWLLAICVIVSFISVRMDEMDVHFISGHIILALIIFRVVWGFIGSRTALFFSFIKGPAAIVRYLTNSNRAEFKPMIGHSPVAALSVVALLAVLSAQVLTGLMSDDEMFLQGPLAQFVSYDTAYQATTYHSIIAKFIVGLVVLHLLAIVFYKVVKKQGLVRPMVTGVKTLSDDEKGRGQSIKDRHPIIAAIAIILSAAIAIYIYNLI